LNSGKPLGTGCCEWLWSNATWANRTLPLVCTMIMTKFYDKIVDEHVLVETVNVDRSLFSSFFKFK